jgi:HK97 family phage portal protein
LGLFGRNADVSWMHRLGAVENWDSATSEPYTASVEVSDSLTELLASHKLTGGGAYVWQWAVHTCVDFIAKNIAQLNLRAYRRTDEAPEPLERDHPLAQLIQRPNPQTTRFGLIRGTVSDLAIYDEAFWLKRFSRGGERRLYQIPATYVEAKDTNVLTGPEFYSIDTGAGPKDFAPSQIVHFHGYDPRDPHAGRAPLKALTNVLNEEREASRYMARLLNKGLRSGGFFTRPVGKWEDKARTRFTEALKRFARGGDREAEWMLLEDGIEPKGSTHSPRDSELMAVREFVLDVTATAYHIPLSMLSRAKTPTFASQKAFHTALYTDVLGPWNAMIEGAVGLQLVPDFAEADDVYVEFNIDEKLQGDFEAQAAAARQSVQVPWMAVDDMRKKRGEPPLGGEFAKPAKPKAYIYDGDEEPEQEAEAPALGIAANGLADLDAEARALILEER